MPIMPNPPAITQQADQETPLVSEMVNRAVAENTLPDVPKPQPRASGNGPMIAALLGGLGDVISTQRNLARGGREQNPLLPQGRLANGLALGGEYLGSALLSKYLTEHGHPTIGKLLGYGAGLDGGAMTLHNSGLFKWPNER